MAVTITAVDMAAALRVGSTAEETLEVTRLLAYCTEAISKHLGAAYADTPEVIVNEAVIRLAGYSYDKPYSPRGIGYAKALSNSGAGAILLPYRVHRAGSTADVKETPEPKTDGRGDYLRWG